jgi:hypothetical protein
MDSKPIIKGMVLPMLIEPNGHMEKFLEIARDPKTLSDYKKLLKKLEADPENFGQKLRESVWKGKSVDDIHKELLH